MNGFQRQCILSFGQLQSKTAIMTLDIIKDREEGEYESSPLLQLAMELCFKASIALSTAHGLDVQSVYEHVGEDEYGRGSKD